eukprot:scaffold24070_cov92-Amphora_coffeaeformis.AAC.2
MENEQDTVYLEEQCANESPDYFAAILYEMLLKQTDLLRPTSSSCPYTHVIRLAASGWPRDLRVSEATFHCRRSNLSA